MADRVFEMLWDCSSCGTRGLLGKTHRQCPNCGAAQDPTRRYFPPPGQEQEAVNHTFDGVDRLCPACGTPNGAKSSFCRNCASPLDAAAQVALIDPDAPAVKPRQMASVPAKMSPAVRGCLIVLGLAVMLFLFLMLLTCWKKEVRGTVNGHSWQRVITIENYATRQMEEWCDSMPSDARNVRRWSAQRSTRQVADGQECSTRNVDNGDGTFRQVTDCHTKYRSEPVYDSRCGFVVDRWQKARDATSSGPRRTPEPYWPAVNLARTGSCIGCEREGGRQEQYWLTLNAGEHTAKCEVGEGLWRAYEDGATVPLRVGVVLGGIDCSSIPKR